jgi:hypothetical protein
VPDHLQPKPRWPPPPATPREREGLATPRDERERQVMMSPRTPREVDIDLEQMRMGLHSLNSVVGDLRGEMARLKREKEELERRNIRLYEENECLHRNMSCQDRPDRDPWSTFDIVEEHYRQLERNRRMREEHGETYGLEEEEPELQREEHKEEMQTDATSDADQAAGFSSVRSKPAQPISEEVAGIPLTGLNLGDDVDCRAAPRPAVDVPKLNLGAVQDIPKLNLAPLGASQAVSQLAWGNLSPRHTLRHELA